MRRLLALAVDAVLIYLVIWLPLTEIYKLSRGKATMIVLAFYLGYFAIMHASRYEGTIGKILLGIKITDLEGRRISLAKSFKREIIKPFWYLIDLIIATIFNLAFVSDTVSLEGQWPHDRIAKTIVVKK